MNWFYYFVMTPFNFDLCSPYVTCIFALLPSQSHGGRPKTAVKLKQAFVFFVNTISVLI